MVARFYCDDLSAATVRLEGKEARHLLVSLRARRGHTVELFDGAGGLARGIVAATSKRSCTIELGERLTAPPCPSVALDVAVAPPKGTRQSWLVHKATELGVRRLTALRTRRGSVPADSVTERWQRIALEASKQCGRLWLPEIDAAGLADFLALGTDALLLLLDPSGRPLGRCLEGVQKHVVLLVGPEGGFDAEEQRTATAAGAIPVAVAPHILRIETAVLAGLAQMQGFLGWGTSDGSV